MIFKNILFFLPHYDKLTTNENLNSFSAQGTRLGAHPPHAH
jgi:hypothetical protein